MVDLSISELSGLGSVTASDSSILIPQRAQKLDVVAFILQQNGYPAGTVELTDVKSALAATGTLARPSRICTTRLSPTKEISHQLGTNMKTIESRKANELRKLNIRGQHQIVKYAILQVWLFES